MTDDVAVFQRALWERGIEFSLRKSGRLYVWPPQCVKHLTVEEREFIAAHKPELTALVKAKALPETTVVWQPPDAQTTQPDVPPPPCEYCHQTPCVGETHHAFDVLHNRDPRVIAAKDRAATAVMLRMVRFGNPY